MTHHGAPRRMARDDTQMMCDGDDAQSYAMALRDTVMHEES